MTMTTWTRETMYKRPDLWREGIPVIDAEEVAGLHRNHCDALHEWTPEFVAAVLAEGHWEPHDEDPDQEPVFLPEKAWIVEALGKKLGRCPYCWDGGTVGVPHRGRDTGMEILKPKDCICKLYRRFWLHWEKVPERFRNARLETMEPRETTGLSRDRQGEIIKFLQANPTDSFFLYGQPGTGKTHMSFALYRRALENSFSEQFRRGDVMSTVWRITASVLITEHRDWALRDLRNENDPTPCPTVRENAAKAAADKGYRPCLFLDELDKVAAKEFQINKVIEMVNFFYEHNGQIVATSNRGEDALVEKWGKDDAMALLRRMGGDSRAHTIAFVPGTAPVASVVGTVREAPAAKPAGRFSTIWKPSRSPEDDSPGAPASGHVATSPQRKVKPPSSVQSVRGKKGFSLPPTNA